MNKSNIISNLILSELMKVIPEFSVQHSIRESSVIVNCKS